MRVALMICSRVLDRHGFNVEHRLLQNVLANSESQTPTRAEKGPLHLKKALPFTPHFDFQEIESLPSPVKEAKALRILGFLGFLRFIV